MKLYEVFGLARSGHHAMINWMIKNMIGYECEMLWKLSIMGNGLYYINEGNLDTEITLRYIHEQSPKIQNLIVSYENVSCDYTILNESQIYKGPSSFNNPDLKKIDSNYRIVFIRNFYDNLASRIKSNQEGLAIDRQGNKVAWDVEKKFIEDWKRNANAILNNHVIFLKFEDWLLKPKKRNQFLKKIMNHGELYNNQVKGTHSSFTDGSVLKRFSQVNIPEELKEKIRQDSELHYLMGRLGYEYIKI